MIKKVNKLFNTLRHLKPSQLAIFIIRRKLPSRYIQNNALMSFPSALTFHNPIVVEGVLLASDRIRFLNCERKFDIDNIDWCPQDAQRLWRYNLHYFDYFRDPLCHPEKKQAILTSWVNNSPQASQPGWEPFTCSLRIVNWVFFLSQNTHLASLPIINSLYTQALWLEKNDERHILANHYFENLKALLFAACFFSNKNSADKNVIRWLKRSKKEIIQQLKEQTLDDGGHYERSPQYHCLMLENYLDIYNLANNNPDLFECEFIQQLQGYAELALDWLNGITFPDKKIPLFNDSAFCVAPSVERLNEYAAALLGYQYQDEDKSPRVIEMHDSGLYGVQSDTDMLLMDCGEIGPSYQPGHSHCDFLNYELMLSGQRLVVDTGVFEYEPGQLRQYVRSTRAHNTVSIDGGEQSEMWGEFRVARRAKKHTAHACRVGDKVEIIGSYSGFYDSTLGWTPRFKHLREISVKLVKDTIESIEVVDTLTDNGVNLDDRLAESYIHFHPDFVLESDEEKGIKIMCDGAVFAILAPTPDCQYRVERSIYCPEFGVKHAIDCVVIYRRGVMPLNLGYCIQRFVS